MKLLFDQNLSPALVGRLKAEFPNSAHVSTVGLASASDAEVVAYAIANGFAICTKDRDFAEIVEMGPVRVGVVWIAVGNCSTAMIEHLLKSYSQAIETALSPQVTTTSETYLVVL